MYSYICIHNIVYIYNRQFNVQHKHFFALMLPLPFLSSGISLVMVKHLEKVERHGLSLLSRSTFYKCHSAEAFLSSKDLAWSTVDCE